eukprot:TRINITY_DN7401_c0_g1_i5.p5 TRINITY_DN7401_c0_g1~~TRINITY_DN7401_c0_g1_i5.p5  ORF type:complete len:108 (-),score=2.15 TRINITY_DN7401_c0_g1_i5:206-529(-)
MIQLYFHYQYITNCNVEFEEWNIAQEDFMIIGELDNSKFLIIGELDNSKILIIGELDNSRNLFENKGFLLYVYESGNIWLGNQVNSYYIQLQELKKSIIKCYNVFMY